MSNNSPPKKPGRPKKPLPDPSLIPEHLKVLGDKETIKRFHVLHLAGLLTPIGIIENVIAKTYGVPVFKARKSVERILTAHVREVEKHGEQTKKALLELSVIHGMREALNKGNHNAFMTGARLLREMYGLNAADSRMGAGNTGLDSRDIFGVDFLAEKSPAATTIILNPGDDKKPKDN